MAVGAIKQLEISFWNEINEIQADVKEQLRPITQEIDKGIEKVAELIIERLRERNQVVTVGIGAADLLVDEVRKVVVKDEILAVCATALRVVCVSIGILVTGNPVLKALAALAICAHILYKGAVILEEMEEDGSHLNEASDALEEFFLRGFANPLSYAVDWTAEELTYASRDLLRAKQFFIRLGRCL